jgi:hypothetical protein
MVRQGGRLIHPWTEDARAGSTALGSRPRTSGPVRRFNPWERIDPPAPEALRASGIEQADRGGINLHPLSSTDDWWTIVLGTGFRSTANNSTRLRANAARRIWHR